MPQSVRYDLLARGVDIQAPTLSEWAASVLARGNGGPRDRSAAIALRLESPHRDVRELLGRHPFLSNDEVAVRLGLTPQLVQRVLRDLAQYGLVGSLGEP